MSMISKPFEGAKSPDIEYIDFGKVFEKGNSWVRSLARGTKIVQLSFP